MHQCFLMQHLALHLQRLNTDPSLWLGIGVLFRGKFLANRWAERFQRRLGSTYHWGADGKKNLTRTTLDIGTKLYCWPADQLPITSLIYDVTASGSMMTHVRTERSLYLTFNLLCLGKLFCGQKSNKLCQFLSCKCLFHITAWAVAQAKGLQTMSNTFFWGWQKQILK